MRPSERQKLYCYVDETGQDTASDVFIVVAVVSDRNQENLRDALIGIEELAGVRYSKWHNSKPSRRVRYIELALDRKLGQEDVFFGSFIRSGYSPVMETNLRHTDGPSPELLFHTMRLAEIS